MISLLIYLKRAAYLSSETSEILKVKSLKNHLKLRSPSCTKATARWLNSWYLVALPAEHLRWVLLKFSVSGLVPPLK